MKLHHRRDASVTAQILAKAPPLSPAFALLAAAAAFPPDATGAADVRDQAARIDDWAEVIALAARHRITGLVAHGLAAAGIVPPPEIACTLATRARADAIGEAIHAAETRRLSRLLGEDGVAPVVVKGMATAMLAFGRLGLRFCRDVDLLVADADVDRTAALLHREGYVRTEPPAEASARALARWRGMHKDFVFLHPTRGLVVELHWRLFDNRFLLPAASISAAAEQCVGNVALRGLPPDIHFAYLCMHGAQHAWSRLKWLADVNAWLAQVDPAERERLYARACAIGAGAAAGQAMLLCGYVFGLDVPAPAFAAARRSRASRWLLRIALTACAGAGATELEDRALGSTWKNIGHYLLSHHWRYLLTEFAFDLRDVSAALPSPALRWAGPAGRVADWAWRRSRRAVGLRGGR